MWLLTRSSDDYILIYYINLSKTYIKNKNCDIWQLPPFNVYVSVKKWSLSSFSSVQSLSRADSLWPHGLQHVRLPCPSPTPRPCSTSCPLSQWCHPTILSSVTLLLRVSAIFPSIMVFFNESVLPMSQFFASGGQSIATSVSASILPMSIHDWFPLGMTGLISLQLKGLKSLLQHHSSKESILWCSVFFIVQFSHPYMTTGKTIALTWWTLSVK